MPAVDHTKEVGQSPATIMILHIANTIFSIILLLTTSLIASSYITRAFGHTGAGVFDWFYIARNFWETHPQIVTETIAIIGVGIIATLILHLGIRLSLRRRATPVGDLHGSAKWANKKDIIQAGLLPKSGDKKGIKGVYIGGWMDKGKLKYLKHAGPEHILVYAPTRSGKGVGLVLPTLLSWHESALIHDPKGEAWAITSGWRKKAGHLVIRFDPTLPSPQAARYNPLEEIRIGEPQEVADAQNLSTIIADPNGKGLEDHWAKTSQAFLTGILLHARYVANREPDQIATLSRVAGMMSDPKKDEKAILEEMINYPHMENGETHEAIAQEARSMLNRDIRERSSIWSTAVSFLSLYRDPMVAAATNTSDFRIEDLMNNEKPVSLYLVVRPSDAARLRPLIRMMLTQIIRHQTGEMGFKHGRSIANYKHRLLFMLDEFPSLERLPVIEEALPYMGGYGLKCYLVTQDTVQIINAYGQHEAITSNCHLSVAFSPNKLETAKLLSEMAGNQTVVHRSISSSGSSDAISLSNISQSLQETGRALLNPDEVMRLPGAIKKPNGDIISGGDMLVFPSGHPPIYGKQILYFQDPIFSKRSLIEPPSVSDQIKHEKPKKEEEDRISIKDSIPADDEDDTETAGPLRRRTAMKEMRRRRPPQRQKEAS